jgi:site-specific DNA recombinase
MFAAIYARRSKEQNDTDLALKSIERQKEFARAFAKKQGWTVLDAHVYEDDGISGAEFGKRPGLQRLLASLPHPPFQRLIVSEQKSIGREMAETMYVVKQLAEGGVEIFEYMHGKSLTPKGYLAKMMSAMQAGVDEGHRQQSSERVHEAHLHRFRRGQVIGGRVFGYDNVCSVCGRVIVPGGHRCCPQSHTTRVRNPLEEAVVVRIFEMYDSGMGLKRISRILTAEGVPGSHFKRNDGLSQVKGWAPSTVNAALKREEYHGVRIWNKTKKRSDEGKWKPSDRPQEDWVRVEVPELRIIDEDLWRRVQSHREETESKTLRFASRRLSGRPPKNRAVSLLAGLAKCGLCGGGLVVESGGKKRGRIPEYICHRHRANRSCTNTLRLSVEDMDETVLHEIESHALTPEAIELVIAATERDDVRETQEALERELKDVEKKLKALVGLVENGSGDVESLVTRIRELEARKKAIRVEMFALRPVPRLPEAVIANRLAEWRHLLRASTTQGRTVLQRIIRGRITFTPRADGLGYDFRAETRFDRLFTGLVVPVPELPSSIPVDESGTASIGPEDTGEADYGRLLDAAVLRKRGVCARRDSNPRPTGSKPVALSN